MKTFQQDDDGHWYLIEVEEVTDFLDLLDTDDESFNNRFFDNMCNHPSNYCFDNTWGL